MKVTGERYEFKTGICVFGYQGYNVCAIDQCLENLTETGKRLLRKNKMFKNKIPIYKQLLQEYNEVLQYINECYKLALNSPASDNGRYMVIFEGKIRAFRDIVCFFKLLQEAQAFAEILSENQKGND